MTDLITHYMRHASSFAATWMLSWFLLYLLVWCAYPALRRFLLNLHPATASSALLALLLLPFITSLVATALVFTPLLEKNLITNHYHSADCESRFPLLQSGMVIGGVLLGTALCLTLILRKFFSQLLFSLKLEAKLTILGEKQTEWYVLPDNERLVFTMGWLNNTIFITEGLLRQCNARELDIILTHEKEHVRRKDNLRLLAGRLLMLIMPAFLTKKLWTDLQLFTEAACDFSSAEKHGPLNVAETLLRVERLSPQKFCFFRKTMISAFTGSEVEGRIMLLLEGKPVPKASRFGPVIYLIVLVGISVLLVDPLHHGVEWLLR